MTSLRLITADSSAMAESAEIAASKWTTHRIRAGLVKPSTGRAQRGELDRFVAAHGRNLALRADRRVFERWAESIGSLSPNTRRLHCSTVRCFVRWCVAEGHMPPRALKLIPTIRGARAVPRALNHDQTVRLVRSLADLRQQVVVGAMLSAGVRCCEVARLRVEDIDERAGTMFVVGKGNNERILPIPEEYAPILSRWLDWRRRLPGPLIPNRHGAHYTPKSISRLVSIWMRSSGVKVASWDGRSAHSLRHTCASDVLELGAPITVVQRLLGHENLSTTATYLRRARLEDLRKAMGGRDYAA